MVREESTGDKADYFNYPIISIASCQAIGRMDLQCVANSMAWKYQVRFLKYW